MEDPLKGTQLEAIVDNDYQTLIGILDEMNVRAVINANEGDEHVYVCLDEHPNIGVAVFHPLVRNPNKPGGDRNWGISYGDHSEEAASIERKFEAIPAGTSLKVVARCVRDIFDNDL